MEEGRIRDKFLGALLGTAVGDALGMPFEGMSSEAITRVRGEVMEMIPARLGAGTYTDDTEMMIALAESLVECREFSGSDLAKRFLNYFDPRRGYGWGTIQVMKLLRAGVPWDQTGEMVFSGGSFGNGAAMRIAPVGVLFFDQPDKLNRVAQDSSRITHTHPLGIMGGVIQARGVAQAFSHDPTSGSLDPESFLAEVEGFFPAGEGEELECFRLSQVRKLLRKNLSPGEIYRELGSDATAPNSVPAALYSFLSRSEDFAEAVSFAIRIGGDTDTVGAMTGAMSGAYLGCSGIPRQWLEGLEGGERGRDLISRLGERLFELWNRGQTSI